MAIEYRLNGTLLTDRVRFLDEGDGFVTAAERGAVGTCGVIIDDPTMSLTVRGLMTFTVDETEAFPYSRVWTGFVAPDVNSGRIRPQDQTTTSRSFDVDLVDQNELLQRMIFLLNAAKRPTETDVARVTYMLTSEAMTGLIYNNGLVSSSNPGTFLASDLRRRYPNDALAELAPSAVKNFFVYRDNATGQASLFYDKDSSTAYSSSLKISNDPADIDEAAIKNGTAMTYPPVWDARLAEQYDQVYTGVSYGWQGEPIYVTSASIAATYGTTRDAVYDTDRVGVLATAQQAAKDWLNVRAGGEKVLPVTIYVPPSKVNEVYAGQRMQVKFTELSGLTSFTWARVRRRAVKPAGARVWEMRLELYIPQTPVSDATVSSVCTSPTNVGLAGTVTGKQDKTAAGVRYDVAPGNQEPANPTRVNDGLSGGGDPPSVAPSYVSSDQQVWQYWQFDLGAAKQITTITVLSGAADAGNCSYFAWSNTGTTWPFFTDFTCTSSGTISNTTYTPTTSVSARYLRVGRTQTGSGLWFVPGISLVEIQVNGCAVAEVPLPYTGDPVGPETSADVWDGTATEGTTAGGWIAGTLVVIQDGIDVTGHVVSEDPVAGTYELDYAPRYGAVIRTRYTSA